MGLGFAIVTGVAIISIQFQFTQKLFQQSFNSIRPALIQDFYAGDLRRAWIELNLSQLFEKGSVYFCSFEGKNLFSPPEQQEGTNLDSSCTSEIPGYSRFDLKTDQGDNAFIVYGKRKLPWYFGLTSPLLAFTSIVITTFFLAWRARKLTVQSLEQTISEIPLLLEDSFNGKSVQPELPIELVTLYERMLQFATKNEELREKLIVRESELFAHKLYTQVAHDIRSPLSALEMLSGSLNELGEQKRTILRNSINRIKDIANSLQTKGNLPKQDSIRNELLMPVIDTLVTEKRIQYRDQLNIEIDFPQTKKAYGLFAKINPNEFKRALSNLINNSIESFHESRGKVSVQLTSNANETLITIEDNGCGIAKDIIHKIGNMGATFNKVGGSGLGVHHAIESVQSWGGDIKIESILNEGTKVTITLPRNDAPNWFVKELELVSGAPLIIFDDDQTIHQIWKGRIESANIHDVPIIHLSNHKDFRGYFGKNFADLENSIFLMDYEILDSQETGIDLIREFGLESSAILVTSRYEEPGIRNLSEKLGIRMIPKSMSAFVPLKLKTLV